MEVGGTGEWEGGRGAEAVARKKLASCAASAPVDPLC